MSNDKKGNNNTVLTIVIALISSGTISTVANSVFGPIAEIKKLKTENAELEKKLATLEEELRILGTDLEITIHDINHEYNAQEKKLDKIENTNAYIIRLVDAVAFKLDFYHGRDDRRMPEQTEEGDD